MRKRVTIDTSPTEGATPDRRCCPRGVRRGAALLALAAVLTPAAALAQQGEEQGLPEDLVEDETLYDCGEANGPVAVNFKPEVELEELITWAMGFTCRNFIFSEGVGGRSAKVTVIAPNRMQPAQAWRLFLVSLQSMNLTVVPKGNVLEVVEAPQAKQHSIPLNLRGRSDGREQVVRVVMRPEHLSADDLASVLSELTSENGEVKPISNANIVVVTDYGSHISQMTRLARQVDEPGHGESLYMLRVRYADASELASKLKEILKSQEESSQSSGDRRRRRRVRRREQDQDDSSQDSPEAIASAVPSEIVADERSNSLVLLASEPAYLRVKALVERLDVQIDMEGAGQINVYRLEHADAEEMAQTLESVVSGIQQQSGDGDNERQRRRRGNNNDEGTAPSFEGEVRITHDVPTNSLVILASVKDFLALRDGVIRQLDVRRPQVYIEAKIVEVSLDSSRELGTSWHGGEQIGDGHLLLGGAQHSDLSSLNPASLLGATGLLGGMLGAPLEGAEEVLFGQSIPSFGVLFQALATSNNVNLLSSPHILTLDNEEAELLVGENIPYVAGSFGSPFGGQQQGQDQQQQLGGLLPGTNIQRQDVALELMLTPQINGADEVSLEIDLEISNIASRDFEGLGPSWSRRTIKDTVIVPDQQTIVIGGLMRDQITSTESKLPLLGDIPLLGYLFKFTTKSKSKTNLLVMLTPYIVDDQLDIERIVERRVREQQEFMRSFSALEDVEYRPEIDYSRKRGLLAEINAAVDKVNRERERLEEFDVGRVEFDSGPVEYQFDEEGEELESDQEPDEGEGEDEEEDEGDDEDGDDEGGQQDEADDDTPSEENN